ncbi:flagellar hook-length control protein FliK [uncultured Desulfobacter sp.]|uniref:flagellar hook-length control protein FliK n=1 Tax=uncultured Desulfobacter sp. TaxID=240139 RepID=UPI002AABF5B3|nr:flagellar hook-length control protein FliK [uncultured Desulfobacter sp.]
MIPSQFLTLLKIPGGDQKQSGLSGPINLKPGRIIDAKILDVKPENHVQLLLSGKSQTTHSSGEFIRNRTPLLSGQEKAAVAASKNLSSESGQPQSTGQKVQASTLLPLKPGMSLTLIAVATREGLVLKPVPSSPFSSSLSLSSAKTDATLKILPGTQKYSALPAPGITPGQTVDAKVLDVTPQNRVQLLVGAQKLTVSTQLTLTPGTDIPMKVVRSQDGIALKPVPMSTGSAPPAVNTERPTPSLPSIIPDSPPLSGTEKPFSAPSFQSVSLANIFQGLDALRQIREPLLNDILMGLSLKSDVRDDQFLPKIIENMGLLFEKKLASAIKDTRDKKTVAHMINQMADQDVKAASLSLSGRENDPGKASIFKHIADALENFAQLNVKSGESEHPQDGARFLLPFPVWTENGFNFGQLMVDLGKTGTANTQKKMLSISFLLNMTALGPLRADFSTLDKTITGRFLLENQETCDYLAPKISNLKQRLYGIGYQAGNIDCQVARPEQIAPASLLLSMKESDVIQGLNIVV